MLKYTQIFLPKEGVQSFNPIQKVSKNWQNMIRPVVPKLSCFHVWVYQDAYTVYTPAG